MPDYRALAQALGTSQPTPQEIERMVAEQSPAFGVFPQMKPYRSQQDITASANVPVDVLRGRIAGTRGLFGDVVNQPIPMVRPLQLLSQAVTGQQKYPDTEHYLETMPLKSNTPIGDVAGATKVMKLLDPGSVVRETELGIAMAAAGRMDRLNNYFNNMMTGQKLTPTQREDFKALSNELYAAAGQAYNQKRSEYEQFGNAYGFKNLNTALGVPATIPSLMRRGPSGGGGNPLLDAINRQLQLNSSGGQQ